MKRLDQELPAIKYTMPGWESSGKSWTDYAIPGHEICITLWHHFLGVVQPIQMARGFLVGEAYSVNKKGKITYMAFVKSQSEDKFFYVGIMSKEDFNRRYTISQ